jgi:hypothetical protein
MPSPKRRRKLDSAVNDRLLRRVGSTRNSLNLDFLDAGFLMQVGKPGRPRDGRPQ